MKHAVITSFLSQTKDRFHTYNDLLTLEEKFQLLQKIKDIDAVEIVFPYEVEEIEITSSLLKKYHLKVAAVNANIKAEPCFRQASLSHSDHHIRAKAIQIIKEAKDFAQSIGANKVQCCPLGDGHEFMLQVEYKEQMKIFTKSLEEAGNYKPEIPLFIEYKPSETRGRCLLENAPQTIALLQKIDNPHMGVTLDFGHSKYGGQSAAKDLCLLEYYNIPYYLHINDNNGLWDWDYFCASHNLLEYIEFIYYVKKFDYQDYITSDTSPTRTNIQKTFEANARLTRKISKKIDELGFDWFDKLFSHADYIESWALIEKDLLGLK